jgi:hypothetical protein
LVVNAGECGRAVSRYDRTETEVVVGLKTKKATPGKGSGLGWSENRFQFGPN